MKGKKIIIKRVAPGEGSMSNSYSAPTTEMGVDSQFNLCSVSVMQINAQLAPHERSELKGISSDIVIGIYNALVVNSESAVN